MQRRDSINHLQQVMMDGGEKAFDIVPKILAQVIAKRLWAERKDKNGQLFSSFESFAAAKLWHGLECSVDDLKAFCRKHGKVRQLIDEAVGPAQQHGANQYGGHRVTMSTHPDTATGVLKRLKRDRPDLAAKVVSGEMSANAAAIEAGFRKKLTKFDQIVKWWPSLTEDEKRQLREMQ